MNRSILRALTVVICASTLPVAGVCQQLTAKPAAGITDGHQVVSRVPGDMLGELSGSLQQLANKVSPAVVQIEVSGFGLADEDDHKEASQKDSRRKNADVIVRQHAIGSGVIVDPDGYIMTNAHVVEGAERIRVTLWGPPNTVDDVPSPRNMRVLNAKLVGLQKEADLALLKVDATGLPTLHFRMDHPAQPGELVFAIGNPEGLQNSVSMGVISSAWRQPDPDNPMVYVQTDAPINPGNSGGPLVDVTGAVLGLNTFILSSGGGSEGLGFAIPARIAEYIYQSLRKYGHVYRTEIGAVAQSITPTIAAGLALAQNWGVVIADVTPRGPAEAAGIEPGDIVLAVDGHPMLNLSLFAAALYLHPPDQVLSIDALRGARKLSFKVPGVLARIGMDHFAEDGDAMKSHIDQLGIFGLDFQEQMRSLLPSVRGDTGVVVIGQTAPGLKSVDAGLKEGDVIHSLNRAPVKSVEQLRSAVAQLKPGDSVVLQIERHGHFQYLAFEMD